MCFPKTTRWQSLYAWGEPALEVGRDRSQLDSLEQGFHK